MKETSMVRLTLLTLALIASFTTGPVAAQSPLVEREHALCAQLVLTIGDMVHARDHGTPLTTLLQETRRAWGASLDRRSRHVEHMLHQTAIMVYTKHAWPVAPLQEAGHIYCLAEIGKGR
jgi:hypothetical protein